MGNLKEDVEKDNDVEHEDDIEELVQLQEVGELQECDVVMEVETHNGSAKVIEITHTTVYSGTNDGLNL